MFVLISSICSFLFKPEDQFKTQKQGSQKLRMNIYCFPPNPYLIKIKMDVGGRGRGG